MKRYLRIWLPASVAAHILLFLLLRLLPALPVAATAMPPMMIVAVEPQKTEKDRVALPARVTPPPVATPPRFTPPRLPVAPHTPIAWNATPRQFDQLAARDPRMPTGGGYAPDPLSGNLPKLNPTPAQPRVEGWADRPAAPGTGMNPLAMPRPTPGGRGLPARGGTQGTAIALLPGAPAHPSATGGSLGSPGGHNAFFPGNGPSGAGSLPAVAGAPLSAQRGGALLLERPGPPGGAGRGANGLTPHGPSRPGYLGSTLSGPTGVAVGLGPGAAAGLGYPNGGGVPGHAGSPFGGPLAPSNLPDSAASGGAPRGITGVTERPGAGGGAGQRHRRARAAHRRPELRRGGH